MPKYTRWYKVGEVSLVRHSISVTGIDTHWNAAFIKPGDMFTPDDGQSFYEVFAVVDDTHLTLKTPYRGETVSNSGYGIVRQFNATTPAELASLMAYFQLVFDKYVDVEMQKLTGKSAYDVACDAGFGGTVSEWLESLKAAGEWVLTQKKVDDLTVEAKTANRNIGDMSALSTDTQDTLVEAINEVDNHADTNAKNIGDFETLRTDAKDTIIKAINEVDEHTDDNTAFIGDRRVLNTDQKNTLIGALNEVDEHANTNTAHIGSMNALTTDSNITLVGAINEVDAQTDANTTKLNGIEDGANKYAHPSYTARTGAETSNQTPSFGETFNVSQVVSDGSGHVSEMNTRTVRIPNSVATTGAAGLMSNTDKARLDALFNAMEIPGLDSGDGLGCAGLHNCLYRGKNLGTGFTAAQKTAIANGTFADLWVGDYWTANNLRYTYSGTTYTWSGKLRIAGFNCQMFRGFYSSSKNYLTRNHHLVIVPDTSLFDTTWDNSATSTQMRRSEALFAAFFGADYLEPLATGSVTNSMTRKALLMSVEMVMGYKPETEVAEDSESSCPRVGLQLPLFMLNQGKIPIGSAQIYWLYNTYSFAGDITDEELAKYGWDRTQAFTVSRRSKPVIANKSNTYAYRPYCLLRGTTTNTF